MTVPPRLSVVGLRKRFGGLQAVGGLDFDVPAGTIVGLVGPNGSGKTTTFNLISGVVCPDAGVTTLDGVDVTGLAPHRIARHGMARTFQSLELFADLSVREHLLVGYQRHQTYGLVSAMLRTPAVKRDEARALHEIEQVRLIFADRITADRLDQRAGSLSYANRRRLEIARALCAQPRILLLDEPMAGMNPHERNELTATLQDLRDSHRQTILLIEHHMEAVHALCDSVVVLDHGEKIAEGPPRAVMENPQVREAYLGT